DAAGRRAEARWPDAHAHDAAGSRAGAVARGLGRRRTQHPHRLDGGAHLHELDREPVDHGHRRALAPQGAVRRPGDPDRQAARVPAGRRGAVALAHRPHVRPIGGGLDPNSKVEFWGIFSAKTFEVYADSAGNLVQEFTTARPSEPNMDQWRTYV